MGTLDQYGQRYTVNMPITGPNGNTVNVRTGWIIKTGSDVPELTSFTKAQGTLLPDELEKVEV